MTYARFAISDAALLELMVAGKQRKQAGALHKAADHAFPAILELIEEGQGNGGDPRLKRSSQRW